ncbi:GNAT family N-acetyltransferase [Bradyrhizobium sp. DN5]|uniref:GNAT family N-acetyltransferase n=1 Tax=Bradyrhizobium sp. DN5 TaxID=3056950 RepID=UPI0035245FD5
MALSYTFRPMTTADLPLIRYWLCQTHVREWWGDPDEQLALVSGDLTEPAMDQFIVLAGNRPFGYLQCYRLTAWNTGFGPQPEGTRGIDQFIGESDMIACGHGSAVIRQFVEAQLRNGVPRIVTDPDPLNACAIRAYEKAGFVRDRMVETPDGPAVLMVRAS